MTIDVGGERPRVTYLRDVTRRGLPFRIVDDGSGGGKRALATKMPETSNIIPFRDGKLQQLQRNFRRRKTGITALDIDGPTLRIAQAEARGETRSSRGC